jgi:hypothetical protein
VPVPARVSRRQPARGHQHQRARPA